MPTHRDSKIQYRTFQQVLDAVADKLPGYDSENLIQPSQMIRVVTRVNAQLGLRITKTHQDVIAIVHGIIRLPLDYRSWNFAYYLTHYNTHPIPEHKRLIPNPTRTLDISCRKNICLNKGEDSRIDIIENSATLEHHYQTLSKVTLREHKRLSDRNNHSVEGYIEGNHLHLNVSHGYIYMNYEGLLEDEEGNLLVLDHPLVNGYYELRVVQEILDNMYLNGEDVINKMKLIEARLKEAKKEAYQVVNTPEFEEFEQAHTANRQAMFRKYYGPFI